jgi:lysophospholipase L1-like esterase
MPNIDLRNCKIVCDGNSITRGDIYSNTPHKTDYPSQLQHQMNKDRLAVEVVNVAISGQSTITLTGGASSAMVTDAVSEVDALFDPTRLNICIFWEGGNELYYTESKVNRVQAAYEATRDYCLLRQSRGFYVVVIDTLPRNNGYYPGYVNVSTYAADILSYNQLVRQNWRDFADCYVDIRKFLPDIQPTTFWMSDGVHPTDTANVLIANCVYSHLRNIQIRKKPINFMAQVLRFTTAGAFSGTVPSNCARVRIRCKGGDGGGGSGRKGAAASARWGGGGGSAGATNEVDLPLSALGWVAGSAFSGTVGAAGTGGPAQATNSTNGVTGTNGGASWVVKGTSGTVYIIYSNGGLAGAGGTATAGTGGSISSGMFPSVAAGSSSATANAANVSGVNRTNGSGAAGGGISTGNVAFAGGIGGRGNGEIDSVTALTGTAGTNTGGNGGNGRNNTAIDSLLFDGGGGGGASLTGNGGNGGFPSGGGGAAVDGVGNSGAGANGNPGYVELTFY